MAYINIVLCPVVMFDKQIYILPDESNIDIFSWSAFPYNFFIRAKCNSEICRNGYAVSLIKNLPVLNHDGMVPFYINHLGRHGARFPTSGKALEKVRNVLILAEQENRLTVKGQELLATVLRLSEAFEGRWGRIVGSRRAGTKGNSRAYAIALS